MKKEQGGKKKITKRWWFWVLVVLVFTCIVGPFLDNDEKEPDASPDTPDITQESHEEDENGSELKWLHGELLEANNMGDGLVVIKAKIQSSFSSTATIDQNYYSIEDFIQNQGGNEYTEIQYWAVADMASGEESKVISFTVPEDVIKKIADGDLLANTYGDYVTDLWVLPSLLE